MAQKPIAMEQLKQVLQLHQDGTGIREIARRTGITRNSVRKYLSRLQPEEHPSDIGLAVRAYVNDLLAVEAERVRQLTVHFTNAENELSKTG